MFKIHRQTQGEGAVKKSIQKLFDPKKDVATRLKHLKNVIDNSSATEIQHLFELHYSHIYFIFFENFLLAESNLRLKGSHRTQRDELDAILVIFEQILINLPELIHQRWQYHSIDTILKRLLHTQNSLKVRREGMRLFLLWLRALRENALPRTLLLYACLVPGFPAPTHNDGKPYSLEWLVNMPINEEVGVHQVEILCLVPPPSGEKMPSDLTKFFLEALLEFMVLEAQVLRWKEDKMATECFSFLWDLFKEKYLPHVFTDFSSATNLYSTNVANAPLPEPRESVNYVLNVSDTGSVDPRIEVASGCSMLPARVSIIKWVVAFTGSFERHDQRIEALPHHVFKQLKEVVVSNADKEPEATDARSSLTNASSASNVLPRTPLPDTEASNSNTSTLTEKEPSLSSLSSLDDKLQSSASVEEDIVKNVLYSTRQNINIVHELFRQAFMLPLTEVPTMRKVVKVYQQWIQDTEIPVFMQSPNSEENLTVQDCGLNHQSSESSLRNTSYLRGQLEPVLASAFSMNVRAGPESTYQLFITNSAHVFLVEPPQNAPKLVRDQVDVCKRVLNLYRFLVMNVPLSDTTWRQLLRVLLHITRVMLQDASTLEEPMMSYQTVAGRLAGAVFQTLIVSWIKANLFVCVSRELWDELVDVLSSLCNWEELVKEWAKNMETMTRVLSRHVYLLELQDLPLDRLTEQKHKKQKKAGKRGVKSGDPALPERSFSRGWSRDSIPSTGSERVEPNKRNRSQSVYTQPFLPGERSQSSRTSSERLDVQNPTPHLHHDSLRHRSSTEPPSPTCVENNRVSPKRGSSETQFPSKTATLESNSSTLKRHSSASDISIITSDKELLTATSPTRHRSDSESQKQQKSRPQIGELSSKPRVAWQIPTHETHSYQPGSAPVSETTSLSVNSLDDEDEFDVLIQERLQTQGQDGSKAWPNEATSINSQDSATIDPDWQAWEDPSLRSSQESDIPSSVQTADTELATLHGARSDTAQSARNFVSKSRFDESGISDNPYQLHQNVSQNRDASSSLLLPENASINIPDDQEEETGDLNPAEDSLSVHDIGGTATTSSEDGVSLGTSGSGAAFPGVVITDEDDILATSSDDILLRNCASLQLNVPQQPNENGSNVFAADSDMLSPINGETAERSIMAGGKKTGWFPDVAVALWRRLLGVLGDVNEIEDGLIHELVFQYLLDLWEVLFKMRQNIGVDSGDNQTATDGGEELVPPLKMMSPWAFKAVTLPETHKEGKLHAFNLLCKMTVQREHDTPLTQEYLAQFYTVLHESLHSTNQEVVNKILGSCSQYFPSCLPASTLLLLDFIYACHTVAASVDLKAPRVEAQTILGSTLCFPNIYQDIPVLNPDCTEPTANICKNVKDYVVEALLTSGKKEPSASARCVALSSTGLWLYEELTSTHQRHSRVKEAINVLLVSLKFNNRTVASVASTQLHLLTHCSSEILEAMPDMPPRIIEVMSLTVSALLNTPEAKNSDSGKQLLVSLLLCILDWCMAVPLELLIETYGVKSEKRLIRTVFKALQTAALGKPGHSAKHSYSLSDLATQDFDPNLHLDKVQEPTAGGMSNRSKLSLNRNASAKFAKNGGVSLAAHTVLSHLTNHLGHFPLARGTSVLTCRVSENHDIMDAPDKLEASLFNSPDVQFLIYNDTCLLSVVEISAEADKPGGGATAGMSTSDKCVRFIIRDAGGKYCWDSSILYGPPDVADAVRPVSCKPISTLDKAISQAARDCCQAYIEYAQAEQRTKRVVAQTDMPLYNEPLPKDVPDRLDQLLQHIGSSSPECQTRIGLPLNIPAKPPECLSGGLQLNATRTMLMHHESLGASYERNASTTSWQCCAIRPQDKVESHMPFHHARLLCAEMGFLSRDNRHRVNLLKKNEQLLRELKFLDSRHCRETHKVAVFYIAKGQEDKLSILSNTGGSKEYEDFVAGLGWEVDLSSHCGFRGKLRSDGSNGNTALYYATSTMEVIYHVSTRFPSADEAAINVKIRHLGNDEVHVVWSEHHRDYRRGIIPTEFGDVLIVIYPIRHGLYRVQIIKKPEVPYFGPLFDGAIVNARILPVLVRETVINAGRAKRSLINLYQTFYEERTLYLRKIIDQFKDEQTFEDYCSHLFSPAPQGRKTKAERSTEPPPSYTGAFDPSRIQPGSGSAPSDAGISSSNNNNSTSNLPQPSDHHRNPFKDAAKRFHHASVFTHSDTIQAGPANPFDYLTPAPTSHPPVAPPLSTPVRRSPLHRGPAPSGAAPLFTFPAPPSAGLSSSAPGPTKTHRQSAPSGHKSHVTFHSVLPKSISGGSHPQISVTKDFPDVQEFPSPPQSPPMDPSKMLS